MSVHESIINILYVITIHHRSTIQYARIAHHKIQARSAVGMAFHNERLDNHVNLILFPSIKNIAKVYVTNKTVKSLTKWCEVTLISQPTDW